MLSVDACNEPASHVLVLRIIAVFPVHAILRLSFIRESVVLALPNLLRSSSFVQVLRADMHFLSYHLSRVLALLVLLRDVLDL